MKRKKVLAGGVLTAVLILGVVIGRSFMIASPEMTKQTVTSDVKSIGPENAPIQIVEFSDFQCPACRSAQDVVKSFLARYPDKIHFIFRHFPLSGHQWAALAHQSAECANQQKRFWPYHDLLYSKQAEWSLPENPTTRFVEYAKESSLNLDEFAACLSDEGIRQKIMAEKEMGKKWDVSSTPTFFVNGTRLVGHIQLASEGEKIINSAGFQPAETASEPAKL